MWWGLGEGQRERERERVEEGISGVNSFNSKMMVASIVFLSAFDNNAKEGNRTCQPILS